jgi:hypothetical protein
MFFTEIRFVLERLFLLMCFSTGVDNGMLITIDIKRYHESHHEFLLLLKLQYRPTRWVRLVEAMALTHFIAGAHKCLINEFPYTRADPFEMFLRW